MNIANITYEDVDTLYEKLKIPIDTFREKSFGINSFGINNGDSISTDKTSPYDEFVDVVCVSE